MLCCGCRGKVSGKSPEEIEALRRCDGVWDPAVRYGLLVAYVIHDLSLVTWGALRRRGSGFSRQWLSTPTQHLSALMSGGLELTDWCAGCWS